MTYFKRSWLALPLLLTAASTLAQEKTVQAEYFVDILGAEGAGTAIDFADISAGNWKETVDLSFLAVGQHRFFFRVEDDAGNWSSVITQAFTHHGTQVGATLANSLLRVESYAGTDNGVGNEQLLTISQKGASELSGNPSYGWLSDGYSVIDASNGSVEIGLRAKDAYGSWSNAWKMNLQKRAEQVAGPVQLGSIQVSLNGSGWSNLIGASGSISDAVVIAEREYVGYALNQPLNYSELRVSDSANGMSATPTSYFPFFDIDKDKIDDRFDTDINVDDFDEDGLFDSVDPDDDNDNVLDGVDAFPLDATEWLDNDGDDIGNNADLDDDNDNMSDLWELQNGFDPLNGADSGLDFDNDGASNVDEYEDSSDPLDPDSFPSWMNGGGAWRYYIYKKAAQ